MKLKTIKTLLRLMKNNEIHCSECKSKDINIDLDFDGYYCLECAEFFTLEELVEKTKK